MSNKVPVIALAGIAAIGLAVSMSTRGNEEPKKSAPAPKKEKKEYDNVIIGDVGGTNTRLQLVRLYHDQAQQHKKETLKQLTVYKSHEHESLTAIIQKFLAEVPKSSKPRIGVVGIAGPVSNNTAFVTNIPLWPTVDGEAIAELCEMDSFSLINDFTAAGYGISTLKHKDSTILGSSGEAPLVEGPNSVKVVIGPGTGLGCGILIKGDSTDSMYEVYASEGGHTDFCCKTDEDFALLKFSREFIENSNNIENLRAKGKVGRVSVERLTAGPAVPLIYAFMKEQHKDLEVILEKDTDYAKGKEFDKIESKDIIDCAMKTKDPLCMKVVEKFTENFGTEAGNLALKCLPYGGVYLIGGVTNGIKDYLISNPKFMESFYNKGRLADLMR